MGDAMVENVVVGGGGGTHRRRRPWILVGALAVAVVLLSGGSLLGGEAGPGEQVKVTRYTGPRHLPIGPVDGVESCLVVDLPLGWYMLPRQPRPESLAEAGGIPLTWIWRPCGASTFFYGSGLAIGHIPAAEGEGEEDVLSRILDQLPGLVEALDMFRAAEEAVQTKEERVRVRGLPKASRSCRLVRFEATAEPDLHTCYALLLVPGDQSITYVWVGEGRGGRLRKDLLTNLEVVPSSKRPAKAAPLALNCPVGDWILRCGFAPPKGFLSVFDPDLQAAARWVHADGASWTMHLENLQGTDLPPSFTEHHLARLREALPDVEIETSAVKVGANRHPVLTYVRPTDGGKVRTAVLGAQDARVRVTWVVEDAPGDADAPARWGAKAAKELAKRFHYWLIKSRELFERELKR